MTNKINKKQIQLIHIARAQAGMDEETYRAMLRQYGVKSSTELSFGQAEEVLRSFVKNGFVMRATSLPAHPGAGVYRDHYATPRQIGLIKHLWFTSESVQRKSTESLLSFIKRISGVDDFAWLERGQVQKVIKAIENL